MKNLCKILIIIHIIFGFSAISEAQNFSQFEGLPFLKNYKPETYKAHGQNFDIVQDKNGIMYFANFAGILAFDGTNWNTIEMKSGLRVLSLSVNKTGRIFAGGLSDFGYIDYKDNGKVVFVSLADSVSENVGMIFKVLCKADSCFFLSEKKMFIYDGNKITSLKFNSPSQNAFILNNELYVFFKRNFKNENSIENGLTIYKDGKFKRIKDESSAQIVDISSVFNTSNEEYAILGTATQGFFILKNDIIYDMDVPVNKFVKLYGNTCGAKISENKYALGTLTRGIIIVNEKGEIIQNIDKKSYLHDDAINALFLDDNGSLWAAENNGISKIEVNWNLSYIDNGNSGLEGKVKDIIRYRENYYFATDKGLYYLSGNEFNRVKGINFACKELIIVNNTLIAGSAEGIFTVKNNIAVPSDYNDFIFCLKKAYQKNAFYAGYTGKIEKYIVENNKIKKTNILKTGEGDVLKIEDDENSLYVEVSPGRIYFYKDMNSSGTEIKPKTKFTALHLNKKGKQIFISSENGLYIYDNNEVKDYNIFSNDTASHKLWIYDFEEIKKDEYLLTDGEQKNTSFCIEKNGFAKIMQTPFLPVSDFTVNTIFWCKETSILWLGGNDGIIMFNSNKKVKFSTEKSVIIRSVKLIENDSLLFLSDTNIPELSAYDNSLKFSYSAPVYASKGQVLYRFFLKGFDKDTSEWTAITEKDYTNLPGGNYTFTVEAKNEFGQKLKASHFSFKILTPVWLRWWMFIIYLAALYFLVRFYLNYRMKAVEKERAVLENLVKERTEEIEQSKEEIESQRDELYKQKSEIVDSINYAKRIQNAVLPSDELLKEVLKNYFVFFKPSVMSSIL